MNFRFFPLIALLLALSPSLFARHILFDSVGVENQGGKKVILHKLDPKDNFYSIGRRYNISPKLIIDFNKDAKMGIGEIIKVPTNIPFTGNATTAVAQNKPQTQPAYTPPVQKPVTQTTPVYNPPLQKPVTNAAAQNNPATTQYKVSAGETLYAISRRFNTTVDDITTLNNLKSTTLSPGQIILVRAAVPSAEKPAEKPVDKPIEKPVERHITTTPVYQQPPVVAKRDSTIVTASDSVDSMGHRILRSGSFGMYEKNEKGVGIWIEDPDLNANKQIILHRTAPIGTVIKITNPMTNRTTFARVVGRINDNENTKDAIVVMTKGVADALGALDKRFHVNISYGSPNE
ncbi:LysM peptidoglycan-binding domain-containing protein [Mucilaginibacter sp. HMF5004]|uniref:DPBB and LysM peptidoglycan-binding domain-containing protein n=1 Tax=Mucilaginibacter rivuli TaxID=2857527 RepID=UPI001C5F7CF5|nr:LysM peptidoglycan-binding domain-containing protein [Mucilaginibacter rivuli]MBW4888890.1 LysM peptidoglycan-binding domain-containing protein [Mucilaginibacter rivuli]